MKKKIIKIEKPVRDLCIDEIETLLNMLSEDVVSYDCSELCKEFNNGVPYCCEATNAIPLLYKAEFEYLKLKTDLWFRWNAKTKSDKELLQTINDDQIFCECKGIQYCERKYRSLTCRLFPLEPFIDKRGIFVGLTFLKDFIERDENTVTKCPLASRANEIRQEFIDSHYLYWQGLLLRFKSEYDTYVYSSKNLRRYAKKNKKETIILYPSWYKNVKSMKEYL